MTEYVKRSEKAPPFEIHTGTHVIREVRVGGKPYGVEIKDAGKRWSTAVPITWWDIHVIALERANGIVRGHRKGRS